MSRRGSERRSLVLVALAAAIAIGGAACGDDDGAGSADPPPTTVSVGDVVFGSGSVPDGFPDDFPIPEAATIGSTLVDNNRGRFEVILFIPAERDSAVVFFEANLESVGYTITADGLDGDIWRIEFERANEQGKMLLKVEDTGITSVALDLTIG